MYDDTCATTVTRQIAAFYPPTFDACDCGAIQRVCDAVVALGDLARGQALTDAMQPKHTDACA